MGAGLLAKAACQSADVPLTHLIREQARSYTSSLLHLVCGIRSPIKRPAYSAGLLFVRDSDQNLNTSKSVRIGVAIGIFGFSGAAGLAWAGACLRGCASAIGGWLANGLSATDNC